MNEESGKKELSRQEKGNNDRSWSLILHNDDHHTFDFVIGSLMEVLDHTAEQAEQCAFIAHTKGKCLVKKGNRDMLLHQQGELARKGLVVSMKS
ncbi:MAG: ATP-dependent Clp protease adaptor ClpS [Bacteroidales bacterium]